LRGNVDTRLRKLDTGVGGGVTADPMAKTRMDAIVLASAGLIRLGLESRITARLDPGVCLPAVTQGVIGIECRENDAGTLKILQALEDAATRKVMDAERAFAARLGGSCQSPIAAYAELDSDKITLRGLVAEPDGSRLLRDTVTGIGAAVGGAHAGCRRGFLARAAARGLGACEYSPSRRWRPRYATRPAGDAAVPVAGSPRRDHPALAGSGNQAS
jgi:hydroxymethylbilane synthase